MSLDPINTSKIFTLPNGGIIRSVSITPYDTNNGFLFCEEERKGFPDTSIKTINSHVIGGKVDLTDICPFQTGIREFCEEVPFVLPGFSLSETTEILLDTFEPCTKRYKDILVSKPKNLYHRFYIVNISEILNDEIREQLYSRIRNWKNTPETVLLKLFWWRKFEDMKSTPSSLFEKLLLNMPNESKCSKKI